MTDPFTERVGEGELLGTPEGPTPAQTRGMIRHGAQPEQLGADPPDHSLKVQAAGRRLGQHGSALLRNAQRMRALRSARVHPRLR